MKESQLKQVDKIKLQAKQTKLVEFKNAIIYQLYNKETDSIIIFCNVEINKNSAEISENLNFSK